MRRPGPDHSVRIWLRERLVKTAWILNGKLVVDANGDVILCETCPCEGGIPCCPNTTVQHLWAFLSYSASRTVSLGADIPPFGCSALTLCPAANRHAPGVQEHFHGYEIIDFLFNVAGGTPPVFKTFLGCWPIRIRYTCIDNTPITFLGIDYHNTGDFSDEESAAVGNSDTTICSNTVFECASNQILAGDGSYTQLYVTDYDPTDGIRVTGYGTIPIVLHFAITLTLSGTPTMYTADLTFSPNDGTFIAGEVCLQWIGCFQDCIPQSVWVSLILDAGTWTLEMHQDADTGFPSDNDFVLYNDAPFPTTGTGDVNFTRFQTCDDGLVPPPWSVST